MVNGQVRLYFRSCIPGIFSGNAQNFISVNILLIWSGFGYYKCANKEAFADNNDK